MKKREDIVEQFSTFLSFVNVNSGSNLIWQTDPELERYIKNLIATEPHANKEFWARYFLQIIRGSNSQTKTEFYQTSGIRNKNKGSFSLFSSPNLENSISDFIAGRHLSAYLQEACLWASQKSYQRFKFLRHKYPLEEYFQIANAAANPPGKLLNNFHVEYLQTNIEGYARTALVRFISNTIYRQDIEAKREKFSDYGLLKDLSHKELKEALIYQGINQNKIKSHCLAWQCFDEIYQQNQTQGNSIKSPTPTQIAEITSYYNQRQNQLNFWATADEEKTQEMLSTCIQAARDYRTKRFLPLEEYDYISDICPTPLDTLIQEETWQQVQSVVSRLFLNMPEEGQIIFKLWLGLNLTQTEIVAVLNVKYPQLQKQYQVARKIAIYNKKLLRDLADEWHKINPDNWEISLNDENLEIIKDALSECLQSHCQKLFYCILDAIELQSQNNKITQSNLSQASYILTEFKQKLVTSFQTELETKMNLASNSLNLVNDKIAIFVEQWLKSKLYPAKQG